MSETLKEVVEQEDESQIVAQEAHDDYYDSRSIIPADNVDADGVPWATVGENIRNGAKDVGIKMLEKMYSAVLGFDVELVDVEVFLNDSKLKTSDSRVRPGDNAVFIENPFILLSVYSKTKFDNRPASVTYNYGAPRSVYLQIRQGTDINTSVPLHLILLLKK